MNYRFTNNNSLPSLRIATMENNYPGSAPEFMPSNFDDFVDTDHYVSINSASRDTGNYPLHYDFRVNLDINLKNIVRIGIVSAVLPNTTGILDEPFLVLDIEEINFINFESSSSPFKGTALLPIKNSTQTTGGFINPELGSCYQSSLKLVTPIAKLTNLSIKFRDYLGNIYKFGKPNGSVLKADQSNIMLKLTTREMRRGILGNSNVY